ncbi:enterobactin-iron receptor [Lactobacillus helveticus]|uniref:enterobactin-iron receptor n=1 Tax=Lactobacillus helveticus TaxID=1587 RepID=UPI001C1E1C72|nr:enterobactin-iron receptor [Lactobacillus helveticus]MBU5980032.1 enterobactin-iron receptor [Lactobacillus helveticus]MCT3413375.1 enterobactin-iron receptor [Lactobacillus helveticus]
MALMINGKKVLGYALGENEYLSGNGVENLNAFYIDTNNLGEADHASFTIDMTKYFNKADAKYPDVQYYQIDVRLLYKDGNSDDMDVGLPTPLLKRGKINNKQSSDCSTGSVAVWFTDKNTLEVRTKCNYDDSFSYTCLLFDVYGFTSQDVGTGL